MTDTEPDDLRTQRVRQLRAEGLDVFTAKKIVRGEELRQLLAEAHDVLTLKRVIGEMIDDQYPKGDYRWW